MKFLAIVLVLSFVMIFVNLFRGEGASALGSLYVFLGDAALLGAIWLIQRWIEKAGKKKLARQKGEAQAPAAAPSPQEGGGELRGRRVAHISCLYDSQPFPPQVKEAVQAAAVQAAQARGMIITPSSRITFNNFGNISELMKPASQCSTLRSLYQTYTFYGCGVEDMLSRTVLTVQLSINGVKVFCHVMAQADQ